MAPTFSKFDTAEFDESGDGSDWKPAVVTAYDEGTGEFCVRFRGPGGARVEVSGVAAGRLRPPKSEHECEQERKCAICFDMVKHIRQNPADSRFMISMPSCGHGPFCQAPLQRHCVGPVCCEQNPLPPALIVERRLEATTRRMQVAVDDNRAQADCISALRGTVRQQRAALRRVRAEARAMVQQAAAELPAARKLTEQIQALSPADAVRGDR
eukprot:COSAG04_NODE_4729_length_1922_cov_2.206253_2_plen_212_part_00